MTEIRLATASNVRSFQSLANALVTSDGQWKEQIDHDALTDEFGRFRVWSGNLGALQKGHSSLDYRLRDSPLLSGNALKFLGELNHNLGEANAIVCGNRLPYEEQPKSILSEGKDDGGEDEDDDFFSDDDDDDEADGSRKELTMRYEEVVDIIDNLYKLSVRIRTPTIRSRSLKAASYQPKDPETGVDVLSSYAQYDKQHVHELLCSLRKPQVGDVQLDDDYLVSRLAHAVTLRRRHFKYWKRHRDKLSVSTILEQEHEIHAEPTKEGITLTLTNQIAEVESPSPVPALAALPSQRTGRTMLSGTEATHHHQSLDDMVDMKSMTSHAVTVTDIHGKSVNLPAPPKCTDGDRDFECPYCYIICPARYGRGRSWRTHLLQDLQPYVCTYPDCEASEQLFRSRREWIEHEASHRKVWRCPEHPTAVYRSRVGLEEHLRQAHLDSFPETQLDTIVNIGETSTIEMREQCPICLLNADAESMGNFTNHLANHLERFATFALPNSAEEDEDGASSVASRGRTGTTSSQDAIDMSLPSDTSEELATSVHGLQRSDEEPLIYDQGPQEVSASEQLLSVESLRAIPIASQNRLDALLASQANELEHGHGVDVETNVDPEANSNVNTDVGAVANAVTNDVEEHLEIVDEFRAYLLTLPGVQTVAFSRPYGSWSGNATFDSAPQAAQAIELFDRTLYPDIKIQQSTEKDRNMLEFRAQSTQDFQWQSTRNSTFDTQEADDSSTSSTSMMYDDGETTHNKQAVLAVSEIPTLHSMYRSRKLLQRDQSFAPNDSYNRIISFCYYDITRMNVDAIVNSANNSLGTSKNRSTLNYHIHKAGGSKFSEEAASKGRLKPGQITLTSGHDLPCAHVIHASRPQYSNNHGMRQFNVLTDCYRNTLKIALISGFKTVAFPCLGAGGCGFPPRVAARVALQEMREFLDSHPEHPFERLIFVVQSISDEKAYMDMFPVFFPPTHGDLESARSSVLSASRASLAAQVLDTRLQVQKVSQELSAEISLFAPNFPKGILEELHGIDSALASIRGFLLGSKALNRGLGDLNLLCSVTQTICGSVTELTESAKNLPFSGDRNHSSLWSDYNNHQKMAYGSDLEQFLEDCQNFAQYLDDTLTRGGVDLDEMTPVRLKLERFKAKQKNEDAEGARGLLDEVLYARVFQRETTTETNDIVRLHQIPSVEQLYTTHKLENKPTMVRPSAVFNQMVCLVREDITKVAATVMVNSTDVTFAGMGTLDRKVFNKGGFQLREECAKFGVCKEGDVKLTSSYNLPSKHILHVVPPEQWRKNSKDVLRQIYREILYTAQSLQATSIAIPAIGTGMLNYPRRDCASLAMEEVNRFLETAEPTNLLEKIIFVVYSSNDEFVYKSLLPVYFPPIDRNVNRALPASQPNTKSAPPQDEMVSAPRRTLFSSIGDAVRNLGSSRSGKRPIAHTWRAINSYEEHALIGFESHAQSCDICNTMEQLYKDKKDLCEHGYPLAQTLLWYMNMGPDQLVYTRPVQIRQSIRLEVPEDMFPLSMNMLRLVEASIRDESRGNPFVSANRAYSTIVQGHSEQDTEASGPTIYNAETARASVEVWSASEGAWSPVSPGECIIFVRPGKIDVYEAHAPSTAQEPLLTFTFDPVAKILKHAHRPGLVVRGALAAQFDNNEEIMLLSQNTADSDSLLAMLNRANPEFPVSRKDLDISSRGLQKPPASPRFPTAKAESDSENDEEPLALPKSTNNAQDPREGRLSPLQAKMQRLNEAASRFSIESPEQQSNTITEIGEHAVPARQQQQPKQSRVSDGTAQMTLTALEHQILYHLTDDLKSRPGSYIGQSANDIASALNRPLVEISAAAESLAKQDYIHNTISDSTWVISRPPQELPALVGPQSEDSARPLPLSTARPVDKTEKADLLFQMDLLEQKVLSFFTVFNAEHPLEKGCRSRDVAEALSQDIEDVELALDQLAEQGKIHLAPDRETWNTPLPRQYNPPSGSEPPAEAAAIRDATGFRDTPPSPVIAVTSPEVQNSHVEISNAADLNIDEGSFYPYDPTTRWTRIDKSYVDPKVLVTLEEDFHEDGYSLVVHRILRRGELKEWVQMTLDLRLKMGGKAQARRGVSGHDWLDGAKDREERDRHQANLDRVLAGDMKEDELRHFNRDDAEAKRR
ncbi:hypothetical protein C7974DRAFT_398175 [Boeremia exigua]|uniref:uncharacterized protein n=1 Tax=Boeremia exigua TaxID=749465 RepID=UPI001E8EDC7A|nr:uncharacterized protein C7974DRAFT_398175 [Boeremia exigua]KAH6622381.1 hypothetical protein C7974DRAFT_398175 [Boeremia exigua]